MNHDQRTRWEDRQRREARIRELRDQRASMEPRRRRFQPLILLGWFAAVAALAAVVIAIGFVAFAPRLMAWVEENPGLIRQGVVLNFVEWYQPAALADVPAGASKQRITIEVPTGASDSGIAQILLARGVIRSELTFQYYVYQAGREGTLQAGTYDLSPSLTPSQIVAALRQLRGTEVKIRIQEGWRLEQIVGYLGTTRLTMNLEDFTRLVKDPPADLLKKYAFFNNLPVGRTLEGYLFPDTYLVDANTTARALVEKLLDTFNQRLSPALRAGIGKQQIGAKVLTIDQAVALASIVEREAVKDSERALIAGVYLNRMNTGGETAYLLQADPTLQWALATQKYVLADNPVPISRWAEVVWWPPLQTGGAQVKLIPGLLGYQTYVHALLPPTPIASPRLASLAAVAAPNRSAGYFFFVAACPDGKRDGSHYFAKTYAEQQANIAKANAECSSRLIAEPPSPATVDRTTRLRADLAAAGLDAMLVSSPAGKRYLSGFVLQAGEEWTSGYSGTLLVTHDRQILLADARYTEQAEAQTAGWDVRSTRKGIGVELAALMMEGTIRRCGAEAAVLPYTDWTAIQDASPATELVPFDERLNAPRRVKDADEQAAIARACALTDACFDHLLETVQPPMTEREIGWEIAGWFRSHGAEALAFEPGVLIGARASMPHGHPSDAALGPGDALLIDFGCQVDGYRSDMTRTIFAGEPSDEARRLHELVRSAQEAAYAAVAVGITGTAVDAAARAVIAGGGLGDAFSHGLGHGIGLETHEEPRLLTWDRPLEAGMVFTLEPGVYLPGQIGIRIEDDVLLTADGPRRLTRSSRDVIVI